MRHFSGSSRYVHLRSLRFLAVNDMTSQIARKVRQLKEKVTKGMRHPGEGHAGSKGDASALLRKLPGSAGFDASAENGNCKQFVRSISEKQLEQIVRNTVRTNIAAERERGTYKPVGIGMRLWVNF